MVNSKSKCDVKIKGVLFDFDNTIVQTEESRLYSLNRVLEDFDLKILETDWDLKYRRMNSHDILAELLKRRSDEVHEIYLRSTSLRREYFRDNHVEIVSGFLEFFEFLNERGVKIVVASGGSREHISFLMEIANLPDLEYLGREDYEKVKPKPDCYLKGLDILNVLPSEAIVFDDSYNGILAGISAGCKVIGINCETEKGVSELDLFMRVKDYNELDFDDIFK